MISRQALRNAKGTSIGRTTASIILTSFNAPTTRFSVRSIRNLTSSQTNLLATAGEVPSAAQDVQISLKSATRDDLLFGTRPIYLDVQATTPTDPRVLDKMTPLLTGL